MTHYVEEDQSKEEKKPLKKQWQYKNERAEDRTIKPLGVFENEQFHGFMIE